MADIVTDVIDPALTQDLISLADAKLMLGIDTADTTQDAQLQLLISQNSASIATLCDRVFGREKVRETWRCVGPVCCPDGAARIYLLHYPAALADIESVETPEGTIIDPADWDLDSRSGKLTVFGGYSEQIVVTYTGGYVLPDEAPLDLQQLAGLMVRSFRTEAAKEATVGSGVRLLAHKESRVMYYSPRDMASASSVSGSGGGTAADKALERVLQHYKRIWC